MNIFYLDRDPVKCAQAMYDSHIYKMILETAQLLSQAHVVLDKTEPVVAYPRSVPGHPCSVWVRSNLAHYQWLHELLMAMLDEYTYRRSQRHGYSMIARKLRMPPENLELTSWRDPPLVMGHMFVRQDAVSSYRNLYIMGKDSLYRYTKRTPPDWHPRQK